MTTTTPRPHAEMAARFMADDSLKCWLWNGDEWALAALPMWYAETIYHVGHESPTAPPKRKITIAGITFDEPETDAPNHGCAVYQPNAADGLACRFMWTASLANRELLAGRFVHLDADNARLHAQALRKLNQELIEQQRGAA